MQGLLRIERQIEKLQEKNNALQEWVRLLKQDEIEDSTQWIGVKVTSELHKEVMKL